VAGQQEDVDRFRENVLEPWVGSKEEFDQNFAIEDGRVIVREDGTVDQLDSGGQQVRELAESDEVYVFYYGDDPKEAVSHVQATGKYAKSLEDAYTFKDRSAGGGTLINTRGRPRQPVAPEEGVFAVVAVNPNVTVTQVGVGNVAGTPEEATAQAGVGKEVPHYRMFMHEAAEKQEFAKQEPVASDYQSAHYVAIQSEAILEQERKEDVGFAGGDVRTTPSNASPKR
jgi:hypothetical protein